MNTSRIHRSRGLKSSPTNVSAPDVSTLGNRPGRWCFRQFSFSFRHFGRFIGLAFLLSGFAGSATLTGKALVTPASATEQVAGPFMKMKVRGGPRKLSPTTSVVLEPFYICHNQGAQPKLQKYGVTLELCAPKTLTDIQAGQAELRDKIFTFLITHDQRDHSQEFLLIQQLNQFFKEELISAVKIERDRILFAE